MAVTPTATVAKLSSHENWTNVEDVDELLALVTAVQRSLLSCVALLYGASRIQYLQCFVYTDTESPNNPQKQAHRLIVTARRKTKNSHQQYVRPIYHFNPPIIYEPL